MRAKKSKEVNGELHHNKRGARTGFDCKENTSWANLSSTTPRLYDPG